MTRPKKARPTAVDLFAGAGGASQGLSNAGFDVVAAVESDPRAAETWRFNHDGLMIERDVRRVEPHELLGVVRAEGLTLLKACPPCQGFSSLRGGSTPNEAQNDLVLDTLRMVDGLKPRAVLLENVPGLQRDQRFDQLAAEMVERDYSLQHYIIEASLLGVPQRRRRLVVVAVQSNLGCPAAGLDHLIPLKVRHPPVTAGEALQELATSLSSGDPWHIWRKSGPVVARRIAAIPADGTRFDLPIELRLKCHVRLDGEASGKQATGSYGRVKSNQFAPTMTTRCTTPACGSFIHPTANRGLSLREAAAFQTFPPDYAWSGNYDSVERQIGNAVPVRMAEALGLAILRLIAVRGSELEG